VGHDELERNFMLGTRPKARVSTLVDIVVRQALVHLVTQSLVTPLGKKALFVKHRQDTRHPRLPTSLNQIQALLVVREVDKIPRYLLHFVLPLLGSEYERVELLLEFLVRVVDAELLEPILLEHLKPEDVQHPNEVSSVAARLLSVEAGVDS
jgi:hypothetical protein